MESGKKFDPALKTAIAIALTFVIAFSIGNILGSVKNITIKNISSGNSTVNTGATVTPAAPTNPTVPAAPTVPTDTTAPTASSGVLPTESTAPTSNPSTPDTTTSAPSNQGSQLSSSSSKGEIISYFNDSVNKIKTSAKKVTRNYEDLQHNPEKLELPSLVKNAGEKLIGQFLKKNEEPVIYDSQEKIIAEYPVHGETFVSKATEADVAEATVSDDGTYYTITLKFKDSTDPAVGTGAASAFNYMKTEDVMNAASFIVKSFSVDYYNCVIVAKIDKATGNTVSTNYTLPMVMSVSTKLSIDAKVGMTFIHDYSIEY